VRYVYDGWNQIASLNPASSVRQSYLWGLDLSGTMQGAGGVGGLLAITDASQGSHFCAYDGNGNVAALVKADGAGLAAQYEYGPFGELLRATGPMARANPFRFSIKCQDDETDLLYYGYRYYKLRRG
ncbi:MAG TPA: RHS repeat protein, partial [Verrucomicrobiota bacterium]|nr:RHS repeat protein [Verrucomicrobiota bacterium]HOR71167.1 RHS repeat protein [Verrucomicrobiota bacterium]HPV10206.1 RHS repeat protein [Verrucomicrobiota bacterium]HQF58932.1 RHS repeat protein [Verrucomicrobiota bacterium]